MQQIIRNATKKVLNKYFYFFKKIFINQKVLIRVVESSLKWFSISSSFFIFTSYLNLLPWCGVWTLYFIFAGLRELWEATALWKLCDKEAVTEGVCCVEPYKKLLPFLLDCPRNWNACVSVWQLLGELLLDRHNFTVMTRYISKPENLKLMMNLLRDKSPNIQFEAFHVFKVTSWLGWKTWEYFFFIPKG